MKLSLVVPTVERTTELDELLAVFLAQSFRDFEVLIVDQNPDDRLAPILARYSPHFAITHMRSSVRNASHARNLGLFAAKGDIVGFPDDDCLYQPDTMARVIAHFDRDPSLAFLGGNCVAHTGKLTNGRWTQRSCEITRNTVWTTIIGFAMWMRTSPAREVGGWDRTIGPGTPWGSCEEPDLILRLLQPGHRGFYDVTLGVYHPDKQLTPAAISRAFSYGAGMGRVLRRHRLEAGTALPFFIRPLGGVLVSLLKRRPTHITYYWQTFRGRLFGYRAHPG